MKDSAESEGDGLGDGLGCAVSDYHLEVHMAVEEVVHGFVPFSVEFLEGCGVPPVLIELPMIKLRNLRKEVRKALKHHNKHHHNQQSRRQHLT